MRRKRQIKMPDKPVIVISSASGQRAQVDPEKYEADRKTLVANGMKTIRKGPHMTQERIEAALAGHRDWLSKGFRQQTIYCASESCNWEEEVPLPRSASDAHRAHQAEAVAAALFSDEAIERAAKALNAEHSAAWEILPDWVKDDWRKQVRIVVAALRGEA